LVFGLSKIYLMLSKVLTYCLRKACTRVTGL
jgi:hypothetical protein